MTASRGFVLAMRGWNQWIINEWRKVNKAYFPVANHDDENCGDDSDVEDHSRNTTSRSCRAESSGIVATSLSRKSFFAFCLLGTLLFAAYYYVIGKGSCQAASNHCQHHSTEVDDPNALRLERVKRDIQRIKDVCKKYENSTYSENPDTLSHWHTNVDDGHEMLYYYIPKTGCTLWKAIFAIVTGKINGTIDAAKVDGYVLHHKTSVRSLYDLPKEEQEKRLKDYFVFVVVRHPFERLVSGYVNKFDPGEGWFQQTSGAAIVKKYRKNATESEISKGIPTFSEFVDYLIDPQTVSTYDIDSHWIQYYKIVHPCYVRYDYIVRFETLREDTQYILEYKNLTNLVNFTFTPPATTNEKLKQFIRKLTLDQVLKLYDAYKFDFELFGYSFDIRDYL